VPELPVVDVERAQQHYRDALGLMMDGFTQAKRWSRVAPVMWRYSFEEEAAIRSCRSTGVVREDIDASYQELKSLGAEYRGSSGKKSLGEYGSSR